MMPGNHKVFLLGLNPGANLDGLRLYLAESLGITDNLRQNRIVFNPPEIVCEAESIEQANSIREHLETYGARIQIKSLNPLINIEPKINTVQNTSITKSNLPINEIVLSAASIIIVLLAFTAIFHFKKAPAPIIPGNKLTLPSGPKTGSNSDSSEAPVAFAYTKDVPTSSSLTRAPGPVAAAYKEIDKQNYPQAWKLLQDYLAENPQDNAAIKGFKYLAFKLSEQSYNKNNNTKEAIQYIESALQYSVNDPDLTAQLGAIYYANNDFEKARNYLEDALRYGSTNPDVHLLLAKIFYYHKDDIALAQTHLQKALETAPDRNDIKDFLNKITKERSVEDNFQAAKSEHFVVKYQGVEDQNAAYTVLYILERAWSDIGYDLGEYPSDPVIAVLYTNKQFSEVTQAPHWAAGIFDGRILLPVAGLPDKNDNDLRRLLYHEYTHVIIHRITKGLCPVWLNEGLAQYMQIRAGATPDPWLRPSLIRDSRRTPPLKSLSAPFMSLAPNDALRAYITSYFAASYLVDEYGLTGVGRLLKKIGEGTTFDVAVQDVLGTTPTDFENRFLQYLKEKND